MSVGRSSRAASGGEGSGAWKGMDRTRQAQGACQNQGDWIGPMRPDHERVRGEGKIWEVRGWFCIHSFIHSTCSIYYTLGIIPSSESIKTIKTQYVLSRDLESKGGETQTQAEVAGNICKSSVGCKYRSLEFMERELQKGGLWRRDGITEEPS